MAPPLHNLKLLDLSRQLPGPFCSLMLADLGVDVKFSDTPPMEPTTPPEFGEHTGEVLRSLGYSATTIEELRGRRVV